MDKNTSPIEYYSKRIELLTTQISVRRRRNRLFVTGEIVTFVLFVALIAAYAQLEWGWAALWAAALSIVAYVVIRRADERNEHRIAHTCEQV